MTWSNKAGGDRVSFARRVKSKKRRYAKKARIIAIQQERKGGPSLIKEFAKRGGLVGGVEKMCYEVGEKSDMQMTYKRGECEIYPRCPVLTKTLFW